MSYENVVKINKMCLQFWKFHKVIHILFYKMLTLRILQVTLMIAVIAVFYYVFRNSSGILCISLNNWKLEETFMQSTNALWKYLIWGKHNCICFYYVLF